MPNGSDQRLEDRQPEALALRGHQQQSAAPIDCCERLAIEQRQDDDRVEHVQPSRETVLLRCEGAAGARQSDVGMTRAHVRKHAQQEIEPLPRNRGSDVQQLDMCAARTEEPRGIEVRCRLGLR